MELKDIQHLAKLSRIAVSDSEAEVLAADITRILGYVREIEEITNTQEPEKKVGALFNVMREDTNVHESGIYTEDLLRAAPERQGQYVKVKKILDQKS